MSESPWLKGLFPISSVFGRVGNIVGQAGDYAASLIGYDNGSSGLLSSSVQGALDELASKASIVIPRFRAYANSGSFTWTVPADMVYADVILVGGGQSGQNGTAGVGGAGGMAGQIVQARLPGPKASLQSGTSWPTDWPLPAAAELSIVVGAGGSGAGGPGNYSYVYHTAQSVTLLLAVGGGSSIAPPQPDIRALNGNTTWQDTRPGGGAGGSGVTGSRGYHSGFGSGGAGGAVGFRGSTGTGFGAGGGGGSGAADRGGGGGAGGYGGGYPSGAGGGTGASGANGARGVCFLTEWLAP